MGRTLRVKVLPYFVGALFCLPLVIYPAYLIGVFEPIPYQDVRITKAEIEDGRFVVHADFVKRECDFYGLAVIGVGFLGASPPLEWKDEDNRAANQANRLAGRQTLRISVDLIDTDYDNLEIKTRHLCGGRIVDGKRLDAIQVDKVFASIPINY